MRVADWLGSEHALTMSTDCFEATHTTSTEDVRLFIAGEGRQCCALGMDFTFDLTLHLALNIYVGR